MSSSIEDVEMKAISYTQEILSQFQNVDKESYEEEQFDSLCKLKLRDFNRKINDFCCCMNSQDIKDHIDRSEYFSNRSKIIAWIIESCRSINFSKSTAYKAISCLDNLMILNQSCEDLEKIEPYAVACIQIAMKFGEKDFIRLVDLLVLLGCNTGLSQMNCIELETLEAIDWDISRNLFQFEITCNSLLEAIICNIEIYQFCSHTVALSVIWYTIMNDFNQIQDSDYLVKIAKRCLQNHTSEFFDCCVWINSQITSNTDLSERINSTIIDFLKFIKTEDSSDDEQLSPKFLKIVNEKSQLSDELDSSVTPTKMDSIKSIKFKKENSAFKGNTLQDKVKHIFLRRKCAKYKQTESCSFVSAKVN